MKIFRALAIAISTYSVLPAPSGEWRAQEMRLALCFLPVVGLIIGAALLLWRWLCLTLQLETALFAAVAALLPLLISGGIHLDGLMDTVDALSSRQSRERQLEIMQDAHCGAFAVMFGAAYLLLSYGLYAQLYHSPALPLAALGFILSRALCVLSALLLPKARGHGMLATFIAPGQSRLALAAMCLLALCCAAGMAALALKPGFSGAILATLALAWYLRLAKKHFGGATGDTCGFFIQVCELSLLVGLTAGGLL